MTNSRHLSTINLDPFLRSTIGLPGMFENMLNRAEQCSTNSGNYPPYNIIEIDEDHYLIEVAVAGFNKDEITITTHDGQLKIAGFQETITNEGEDIPNPNYLHKGISARSFEREWALAEHVEVTNAQVENGLLQIELAREIPEALKPKTIKIK